jgi:hypothetical protein
MLPKLVHMSKQKIHRSATLHAAVSGLQLCEGAGHLNHLKLDLARFVHRGWPEQTRPASIERNGLSSRTDAQRVTLMLNTP